MTILKRITMCIAPFMVLFLFSFKSSAEAAPELTQATFEVIEGGMQDMLSIGARYYGISPYSDAAIAAYEIMGELYMQYFNSNEDTIALWTCDSDDVVVEPLSNSDISYLDSIHVVDRLGHSVDLSTCYRVSYNNGYFHGDCYIDQYGDLLYDQLSLEDTKRKVGNIAFGGNLVEWSDFNNFYEFIADTAAANQMNVLISDENVDFSDISYFLWCGCSANDYSGVTRQSVYIFIPNVCDMGNITCSWSGGNYQNRIYYNSDSNWVFELNNIGNASNLTDKITADFNGGNYDGYTYSNLKEINSRVFTDGRTDLSYADFSNYTTPWGLFYPEYFLFGYHCASYETYSALLNKGLRPRPFRPVEPNEEEDPDFEYPNKIPEEYLDLSDLEEFNYDPSQETEPEPNPEFDPDEEITPDNYPEIFPLPTPFPQPSPIPIQGVDPIPDPTPDPLPVIEETPVPMPADDGGTFSKIPFISNIQYRFPFSIPWDLKAAVGMLVTPPEPPAWDFVWDITVAGHTYSYHCVGDLSDFDPLARILRLLFLISALVSLAVITYKMYF